MIKFIDTNIFMEGWSNPKTKDFIESLNRGEHCTSVLVLSELYHKLKQKNIDNVFDYIRSILGTIEAYDITKNDLFNAIRNQSLVNINDKIHIEVMKRNNINTIISFDKDFDRDKTIKREKL